MAIISSLLDTDLYKLTMLNAVLDYCKRVNIDIPTVQYRFKCRNKKNVLQYKDKIHKEIEAFKKLIFTAEEYEYLESLKLFSPEFLDYISNINLQDVSVAMYNVGGELQIDIEGSWATAILFEVPVLSIVNEIYFKNMTIDKGDMTNRLKTFLKEMIDGKMVFTDFGTRRRFSKAWQGKCIREAMKVGIIEGTSNVMYAQKYDIKPVGTMAHEWLQAFQALSKNLENFQIDALNNWMLTYRGKLDTALTDIVGIDAFLDDWDKFFANNYSGLRHDSGSPFDFVDKVEEWCYKKLGICAYQHFPRLLFSDSLTPEVCAKIKQYCQYRSFHYAFGIGTNFTNNTSAEALQIVIKLTKVNGQNVIKLSDSKGKRMNDDTNMIHRLTETFGLTSEGK